MASIDEVFRIINTISEKFEDECIKCLEHHKSEIADCIREQLYSGLDGTGHLLNPTYDNDPYFKEEGFWKDNAQGYKRWKASITPPVQSENLFLPPRPIEVPNLFITGTFHESIYVEKSEFGVNIGTRGFQDGPLIEKKYGEQILNMGEQAIKYFNNTYLLPWLIHFFENCGYK